MCQNLIYTFTDLAPSKKFDFERFTLCRSKKCLKFQLVDFFDKYYNKKEKKTISGNRVYLF